MIVKLKLRKCSNLPICETSVPRKFVCIRCFIRTPKSGIQCSQCSDVTDNGINKLQTIRGVATIEATEAAAKVNENTELEMKLQKIEIL